MNKESIDKFITKFKELWHNKKYHALIKLALYISLIVILFLIFDVTDKTSVNNDNNISPIEEVDDNAFLINYKASYYLNDELIITGIKKDNKEEFNINGNSYYIEDEVIYSESDTKEFLNVINNYNLLKLGTSNLSNIIATSTKVSSTTDLENNATINSYKMLITSLSTHFDIYSQKEGYIYINETIKNNIILEISIDLTNYYDKDYIIKIEYEEVE